jgi:hypothetical protein
MVKVPAICCAISMIYSIHTKTPQTHPASGGFWTAQVVDFSLGQLAELDLTRLTKLCPNPTMLITIFSSLTPFLCL